MLKPGFYGKFFLKYKYVEQVRPWTSTGRVDFIEDRRLGNDALKAFEGTVIEGIIIVPAIVLAEIMFIAKKGKIPLSIPSQ